MMSPRRCTTVLALLELSTSPPAAQAGDKLCWNNLEGDEHADGEVVGGHHGQAPTTRMSRVHHWFEALEMTL